MGTYMWKFCKLMLQILEIGRQVRSISANERIVIADNVSLNSRKAEKSRKVPFLKIFLNLFGQICWWWDLTRPMRSLPVLMTRLVNILLTFGIVFETKRLNTSTAPLCLFLWLKFMYSSHEFPNHIINLLPWSSLPILWLQLLVFLSDFINLISLSFILFCIFY